MGSFTPSYCVNLLFPRHVNLFIQSCRAFERFTQDLFHCFISYRIPSTDIITFVLYSNFPARFLHFPRFCLASIYILSFFLTLLVHPCFPSSPLRFLPNRLPPPYSSLLRITPAMHPTPSISSLSSFFFSFHVLLSLTHC